MEAQSLEPGLACKLDFAMGKDLKQKLKRLQKLFKSGDMVSKLV